MKLIRTFTLILVVFTLFFALKSNGASYLDNISVSPYAAVVHHNITDGQSYGAGVALGLGINKFVSLELGATSFSDNDWGNSAIDEASLLVKARLVHNANETFSLYGLAGGDRQFEADDWAFGVGLGVELRLAKNISLFGDSRIRSWFNSREDLITRAGINLSF